MRIKVHVMMSVRRLVIAITLLLLHVQPGTAQTGGVSGLLSNLVSHDGAQVDVSKISGKIALLSFGFTHCPDICPLELAKISRTIEQDENEDFIGIFVTLDPERDNAARLATYVTHFSDRIVGVTGSLENITQITDVLGVRFSKVTMGDSYTIDHSTGIYLIGRTGTVEAIAPFGSSQAHLAAMAKGLRDTTSD